MPYLRPTQYFLARFYDKQETAWLGYKAGLDLVLDWGRRSGKTRLIAEIMIEDIEEHGRDCLYIALTQGQAREIMWSVLEDLLEKVPMWKSNAARLEWCHIPSNSIISLKGADLGKDRLRGNAKRIIALDEFAFYRDPTIVKDVLLPQLSDYNGQFIYCSTPKGKNHFWELKQKALRERDKYFTSHATIYDNPFIDPQGRTKVIAEYAGSDDPLFRQEIMAEYVNFQGLVVALPPESYVCDIWDRADFSFSWHWRGVDHGYSPDPTACVWIAYNERKGHFLVYNEYKQAKLLIRQHAEVINELEKYQFNETYSDIDPQVIAEYDAVGLPMARAVKYDKEARLLRLVNALSSGKLKIARHCQMLLKELSTYEWGQDGNDHLVDALLYGFTNLDVPRETIMEKEEYQNKIPIDFNNFSEHSEDYQTFD